MQSSLDRQSFLRRTRVWVHFLWFFRVYRRTAEAPGEPVLEFRAATVYSFASMWQNCQRDSLLV
jgi:hypothetical protein